MIVPRATQNQTHQTGLVLGYAVLVALESPPQRVEWLLRTRDMEKKIHYIRHFVQAYQARLRADVFSRGPHISMFVAYSLSYASK